MSTNAKTQTTKTIGLTTKVTDLKKEAEAKKKTVSAPVTEPKKEELKSPVIVPVVETKKEGTKQGYELNVIAETRLKNLDSFAILGKRYRGLKAKVDELNLFNIANDGTRVKLMLIAEGAEPFQVNNTETITKAIKTLEEDLKERISKTEKEVQEFQI